MNYMLEVDIFILGEILNFYNSFNNIDNPLKYMFSVMK